MTRDFNKQRRNDAHPPFRNSSSNYNNRDEHSPRPSRPRLNREAVDRAWESGAPQRHADYRPRDNNRQGGQYGHSPRNTHNNYNNPNSKPRVNNRYGEPDYAPRREYNERGYPDRRQGQESYRESRDTRGNRRDGYRDNRYESPSHFSHQDRRPYTHGNSSYGNNGQRFKRQDDYQGRDRHNERNGHYDSREEYGPRNYSRPYSGRDQRHDGERGAYQQDRFSPRQHAYDGQRAQFEGDYESFNEQYQRDERSSRPSRSDERPFRGSPHTREERPTSGRYERDTREHSKREQQPRERHVTPLPDGRVLKGSRPAQRRNARFWTDVSQETDELMNQVSSVEQGGVENDVVAEELPELPEKELETVRSAGVDDENNEQDVDEDNPRLETEPESSSETPRRRTRAASAIVRGKKEKGTRGSSAAMKPSQPGFKWPTQ